MILSGISGGKWSGTCAPLALKTYQSEMVQIFLFSTGCSAGVIPCVPANYWNADSMPPSPIGEEGLGVMGKGLLCAGRKYLEQRRLFPPATSRGCRDRVEG
jgi:hypothetical protein